MKKHLLSLFALATMLFATSCSEDENIAESNQQNATFQIELEDAGNGSRALADGTVLGTGSKVNRVYYAVYETGKDQLLRAGSAAMTRNNEETVGSVVIPLVNGLKFDIAFFAHYDGESSAFTIPADGDLRNIALKSNLKANQETYDAFFKVLSRYQTNTSSTTPVELTRAMAQLNVATTDQDLKDAASLLATVTQSKITLKGVPNMFNARTGSATGEADVIFNNTGILKQANGENETLTCNISGNDEKFNYLAMAYVLANDQSALFDSEFEFYRAEGDAVSKRSIPNLPLQRNYRTNVTGNILTQQENFSITVDASFGNNAHNVDANDITVESVTELNSILEEKAKVNYKELILNVNGLANEQEVHIEIPDNATVSSITLNLLDITNTTTTTKLSVSGATYNKPVVISIKNETTITETYINVPNAHVTLKNGTHTTVYSTTSSNTLEVAGGTIITNLIVNAGNVLIKSEGEVTKIERGDDNVDENTIVSVEPGAELGEIEGGEIETETTLGNENEWILTEHVTLYGPLTIAADKFLTIDLNGFTLSQTKEQTKGYSMILNDGNLTITDSSENGTGKISYTDSGNGGEYVSATITNRGTLTIKSGTIENISSEEMANVGYAYTIDTSIWGEATEVITNIEGGVVSSIYSPLRINAASNQKIIKAYISGGEIKGRIDHQMSTNTAAKGELYISGGKFTAQGVKSDNNIMIFGSGLETDASGIKAEITGGEFDKGILVYRGNRVPLGKNFNEKFITGGKFHFDPSAYVPSDCVVEKDDNNIYTIKSKPVMAKIGSVEYKTLQDAVNAVQDGETITLIANETFTEANRTHNSGTWYDGMYYIGDKSFTIDLNGKTIGQDGAVNDYLLNFKNDGAKENIITLKNGTIDAGTAAFCALATASTNAQKITINLENIKLIGNNSGGAVLKIRGGNELNVNAGTIIEGMNSYVGIEAVGNNTVVNIYDGAKIYQKGTSSYVGAIVGASYNATMNIYGGYGKSAKCGIIVMSTGATINVSGGEWIANNDGTVAAGNQGVLVSQNNRNESGWACKSVLNVTGGTFKGGYDCWGMGPGQEADDAQINIKGGNFNADPTQYVVAGYEVTDEYTVGKSKALTDLETAIAKGGNVTLADDVTLLESLKIENTVVLDLNGKTITAPLFSAFEVKDGGDLTIKNGKVVAYESTVRAIGGKATIESGEYTSTGTALDTPSTKRYSLDCREGGELIVNGGTFKSNNGMINVGSTVTINGGKFENIVEKATTRHFAYVSALLTINDGEFYGKANSGAGGCFFCGAAASGDIQIKGGKFTSLWTSGSVNRIFEVYFGGTINVTGGMFNTNGGIAGFVTENTNEATKAAYPYVAK